MYSLFAELYKQEYPAVVICYTVGGVDSIGVLKGFFIRSCPACSFAFSPISQRAQYALQSFIVRSQSANRFTHFVVRSDGL
jgi:hypothetical protein